MKITVDGQKEEAYALIMRKENALEILHGTKTVEIREANSKYEKMFTDQDRLEKNRQAEAEGRDEWQVPVRTDVAFVHFYNYNNSWSLDCEIDEIGTASLTEEDVDFLNQEFGFHELDNEWQEFVGKPDDEIPFFFYLNIKGIVAHRGLD